MVFHRRPGVCPVRNTSPPQERPVVRPETQFPGIQRVIPCTKVAFQLELEEVNMEASAPAPSALDRYRPAAGPLHTICVLAILGVWAYLGRIIADQMRAAVNPHRLRFYLFTLFFEWLLFIFVVVGVRRSGAPVRFVLGDRWQSVRQVLRDIGIAAAFWLVSAGILLVLGWLLRVAGHRPNMEFILPHGGVELAVWIALSITAGICEEPGFVGY